jgi:hypothetical protein
MLGKGASQYKPSRCALIKDVLASHDNDRKIPRTLNEIYDLNNMLAMAMEDIFLNKGVPVVPSLGEFANIHLRGRLTQVWML